MAQYFLAPQHEIQSVTPEGDRFRVKCDGMELVTDRSRLDHLTDGRVFGGGGRWAAAAFETTKDRELRERGLA